MKNKKKNPWEIKDIVYVFLVVILISIVFKLIFSFICFENFFEQTGCKSLLMLGLYFLQILILLIPLAFFTLYKYRSKIKDFGFNKINILKTLPYIFGAYLAFIGLSILIAVISSISGTELPGFQSQSPILPLFGTDNFSFVIAIIVIVIIAPIIEEMFFRGYILQTLSKNLSTSTSSIITALIFASVHFEFQSFIPIFLLGIILNWLFLKFNSIWPSILFHFLNNIITFTIFYYIGEGI